MKDVEFHQLVSAYLVQTNSTNPAVTKTFEISLAAGKGSNKVTTTHKKKNR